MEWHIGCSGFHYNHWKVKFYPEGLPQRKWFDYYCEHFKTLELNVTFYRFPQLSFLQTWHQKSPSDFRFAVKAPRAITHYKKFKDTTQLISSFYETINDGLREKLGPVLFQMPPRYDYNEERLERIINSLDNSFINVLEPRHVSWWRQDVYEELGRHNISFCGMSHPLLPDEVVINTPQVYYRFHGVPFLYTSSYPSEFLQKVSDTVKASPIAREGWGYFNNDSQVAAIENAKRMMGMV